MASTEQFMTIEDLSARWDVPRETLGQWRSRGQGPDYVRIMKHVRYRVRDVEAYEAANSHEQPRPRVGM